MHECMDQPNTKMMHSLRLLFLSFYSPEQTCLISIMFSQMVSTSDATRWVVHISRDQQPALRMFCYPHTRPRSWARHGWEKVGRIERGRGTL